jgi:thioredoxin 1
MGHYTFEVTDQNFQEQVLQSEQPVLIDFWADWCPPCRMLEPIINELAQKYNDVLRVGKLDVDTNPVTQETYDVMAMPTLMLFKGGQPVMQLVGYRPKHQLESILSEYLAQISPTPQRS